MKCVYPNLEGDCSGCTDGRSEGTHQGCTKQHGHIGCDLDTNHISKTPRVARHIRGPAAEIEEWKWRVREILILEKMSPDAIEKLIELVEEKRKTPNNLQSMELKRAWEHGKHEGAKEVVAKIRGKFIGIGNSTFEDIQDNITDALTEYLPKILP